MVQGQLKRLDGWKGRLAAEMDRQRRVPFQWGAHDCSTGLALAAVEAITGADLRGTWGGYTTAKGAYRAIHKAGFDTLGDLAASLFEEIHPAMAQVGDLGLIRTDGELGEGLAVFDRSGLIILTDEGQGHLPRANAVRAFRVG